MRACLRTCACAMICITSHGRACASSLCASGCGCAVARIAAHCRLSGWFSARVNVHVCVRTHPHLPTLHQSRPRRPLLCGARRPLPKNSDRPPHPKWSSAFTSAPCESSASTTATCLEKAAQWSGVYLRQKRTGNRTRIDMCIYARIYM